VIGKQNQTSGRGEFTRQIGEFGFELLEAQIDAEAFRIFPENAPDGFDLFREAGGMDLDHWFFSI
jgi:hypothetical protein